MLDDPLTTLPIDASDLGGQPNPTLHIEQGGVPLQVGQNVVTGEEGALVAVGEVAEGSQDPAGVRVHTRPHTADALQTCPLAAQDGRLLEHRGLKALAEQPASRNQSTGPGSDHRHALRHVGTVARRRAGTR